LKELEPMPYTTPTLAQFRARFPIFEDAEDSLIEALLAEAAGQIDTSWREADYQPAILYLTAHLLATDNSGEGEDVEIGGATGGIASESWGSMSVSYATKDTANAAASASTWGSTEYGRRFYTLLRANKPAVIAI
jgi:hypothetical protein